MVNTGNKIHKTSDELNSFICFDIVKGISRNPNNSNININTTLTNKEPK